VEGGVTELEWEFMVLTGPPAEIGALDGGNEICVKTLTFRDRSTHLPRELHLNQNHIENPLPPNRKTFEAKGHYVPPHVVRQLNVRLFPGFSRRAEGLWPCVAPKPLS